MLGQDVNRALVGLQGEAFGHQKIGLASTLRLHNDAAACCPYQKLHSY